MLATLGGLGVFPGTKHNIQIIVLLATSLSFLAVLVVAVVPMALAQPFISQVMYWLAIALAGAGAAWCY